MSDEIADLLKKQGEAFEAFKETLTEEKKAADAVTTEKLSRIETDLHAAVEAKASLEAKIEAERKEREELELRLAKRGASAIDDVKAAHVAEMSNVLSSHMSSKNRALGEFGVEQYDEYKAAMNHLLREGKESLTAEEIKTLSVGSDPDGGYFVTPDTSGRIVKKIYETSPARQIFSAMSITTDKLEGIEDLDEAGAGYAGETTQSGDTTTPQIGKWSIPVYWIDTEPKTTQQLLDDSSVDIEAWLSDKVADKLGRFENAEFIAGSSGKIRGLTSYSTLADSGSGVAWGKLGHVKTGVNGGFDATDSDAVKTLLSVIGALKNHYLTNARWLTNRAVITEISKWQDDNGQLYWRPSFVAGQPETILGYPVTRAEDMPAMGTGSLSLAFGDFAAAYQIVDRQGIRVMRDPYTAKPFVKFYTTKRVGGGVVNFEAAKFVKFTS